MNDELTDEELQADKFVFVAWLVVMTCSFTFAQLDTARKWLANVVALCRQNRVPRD